MMTIEEYRIYCGPCKTELAVSQQRELAQFLRSTAVKVAMGQLFEQIEGTKGICLEADLSNDTGLRKAMGAQGQVKGMLTVIERLLDMAANIDTIDDDEEGDEDNG